MIIRTLTLTSLMLGLTACETMEVSMAAFQAPPVKVIAAPAPLQRAAVAPQAKPIPLSISTRSALAADGPGDAAGSAGSSSSDGDDGDEGDNDSDGDSGGVSAGGGGSVGGANGVTSGGAGSIGGAGEVSDPGGVSAGGAGEIGGGRGPRGADDD